MFIAEDLGEVVWDDEVNDAGTARLGYSNIMADKIVEGVISKYTFDNQFCQFVGLSVTDYFVAVRYDCQCVAALHIHNCILVIYRVRCPIWGAPRYRISANGKHCVTEILFFPSPRDHKPSGFVVSKVIRQQQEHEIYARLVWISPYHLMMIPL